MVPTTIFALHPWAANFLANQATVQFFHRLLATLTALTTLTTAVLGLRAPLPPGLRDNFLLLAAFVVLQYLLGMATLVMDAPNLGYIHELNAVLLLTAAICARHGLRGANSRRKLPHPYSPEAHDMSEALNTAEKLFHAQGGLDPVTRRPPHRHRDRRRR